MTTQLAATVAFVVNGKGLRTAFRGLTAITGLAKQGSVARVLVLTTYDTDTYVVPAIEIGATGYLLKDAPRDELLRAVRAAAAGESVLSPSVVSRLVSRVRTPAAGSLTQREIEVLELVAAGNTNRETAVAEGFRRGLLSGS